MSKFESFRVDISFVARLFRYVERGNEGSILFYVLDPHSLPRLELLVARVVDREAVDEAIARLPSSLKKCVALRQVVSKFSLAPVTTDFIRFLRETKAGLFVFATACSFYCRTSFR